ncbi:glycerophosphodiester phosphodiesterase [Sphingomonas spermidinifaciens]|uniref:glycerophosphodiester phosphodiesterase n=1 Tax=Sphingomonas spermidinifaciens TaxID=1141889 RepID=A0A2A4B1R4_9SPHN|nr:glycerophosphodiester phosphodiesterase [Sphingomonas spermidinifaciens]PCD03133.1 glycerophosphodiester phosphodiesterase [Sphingomonas spermidinifaciens]
MLLLTMIALAVAMPPSDRPIVIAHRGASGERPEHTLAAYERAIEVGADFIEPDLVLTKDDVLVARHENDITDTTDVAAHPEFASRKTIKTIDGARHEGWFTEDFTLAELKTLRAKERLPQLRPQNAAYDGKFEVPTLAEVIALAKRRSKDTGRTIGIYPETKHPTYFASIGKPMERRLVDQLHAAGWDSAAAPVFIQSFEVKNLKALRKMTQVRLIQLVASEGGPADGAQPSYAAMLTPAGLKAIADYADGIGPEKKLVVGDDGKATTLVVDAHRAGLKVHPWTIRAENYFLPPIDRAGADPRAHGRLRDEIARQLAAGADGFFTDFPYDGVAARDAFAGTGK